MANTDMLNKWAKMIAVEVAPEYEPLAPMMMTAYLRGGKERKQLFESASIAGGFLPDGGLSFLPYAFLALSGIAAPLMQLCSSLGLGTINDLLNCWKSLLEVIDVQKKLNEKPEVANKGNDTLAALRRVMDEVQKSLKKQGLTKEQADLVSYRVMKALLQEPNEGAQFIQAFQEGKR